MEMPFTLVTTMVGQGLIVSIRDEDNIVMDVSARVLAYEAAVAEIVVLTTTLSNKKNTLNGVFFSFETIPYITASNKC